MATADVQAPVEPAAALPDYVTDPDAVLKDQAHWRYGRAPDYSKTRKVFAETKTMSHEANSLPQLVENLVKNWEVEASFKPTLSDWRTVDHANYSFAINGSEPQNAEHMLKQGTYNAIIAPNEYYSPEYSDFASSHKTFKRMMPTFAWEVLEVYSGPPTVSFRWRHWGVMKNDYVGFNNKGEKVTAKAHGGAIDIQGVTVATVNDKLQLQSVRTWFDPMDMFRQIAPDGVVKKDAVDKSLSPGDALDSDMKAEIDQKPRPKETSTATPAIPDGHPSVNAQKLMKDAGCPFAGTSPKEAVTPYPPAAVDEAAKASGKADKLSHPNLPLRPSMMEVLKSGEQEGVGQDPYITPAPDSSS
ncbi:hypothetical protein K458DRAFT_291994 [Lentithecium fluviatile CBS 122367]|uniref:Pathogen-related protein n=1 Tax=Lentithecium fluviatile CBS 122367 TaxID=1168545 RepID=A0A6G1JHK7_9PLEO|nr:hypothetical protein K458DRAFT_291994 [Lentithecium fluviatile CBS 122367]